MKRVLLAFIVATLIAGCNSPYQQQGYNPAMADMSARLLAAGQRLTPQQRAATLSGMAVMPPTYSAPAMRTTNCNAFGNSVNCTSF